MELDKIMQMLKGKTEPKLVRFISDKGPNSCKACLEHHGKIFRADAADKPQLPIHPNCRCKYEEVKESDAKTQSSGTNNSKIGQFLRNLPEAVQNVLEMKYLATGTGEIIGGAKVASILVTDYKIWAARARDAVLRSKTLSLEEQMDIYDKLKKALEKNDIRTILMIYNKYK